MSHNRYLLLLKRSLWIHSFRRYELSFPHISLQLKIPNFLLISSIWSIDQSYITVLTSLLDWICMLADFYNLSVVNCIYCPFILCKLYLLPVYSLKIAPFTFSFSLLVKKVSELLCSLRGIFFVCYRILLSPTRLCKNLEFPSPFNSCR